MDGGFVTVADGEVHARVALPVGGMMSDAPFEETAQALREAHAATHALGCEIPSPYIILSFVGLYVVPDLGITELGLIDVPTQQFVDVLLPGPVDTCGGADIVSASGVDHRGSPSAPVGTGGGSGPARGGPQRTADPVRGRRPLRRAPRPRRRCHRLPLPFRRGAGERDADGDHRAHSHPRAARRDLLGRRRGPAHRRRDSSRQRRSSRRWLPSVTASPRRSSSSWAPSAGCVGGMVAALLPALLTARWNVNIILSTLLLNYVAAGALALSLRTWLGTDEQTATPQSARLPDAASLPTLIPGTRAHWGLLLVVVLAALLVWWGGSNSSIRLRIFASRPLLARRLGSTASGVVYRTMLVSGAGAGVVGWIQVAGVNERLMNSVSGGVGFSGIAVALLGALLPLGVIAAALFFSALTVGAIGMQAATGTVPVGDRRSHQGGSTLGRRRRRRDAVRPRGGPSPRRSGVGAPRSSEREDDVSAALWISILAGALALAVPLIIAGIGEGFVERAGRLNLGIEGMMILGAFTGVYVGSLAGPVAGLAGAIAVGTLVAVVMNVLVYRLRANEIVVGLATTMLGLGLSTLSVPALGSRWHRERQRRHVRHGSVRTARRYPRSRAGPVRSGSAAFREHRPGSRRLVRRPIDTVRSPHPRHRNGSGSRDAARRSGSRSRRDVAVDRWSDCGSRWRGDHTQHTRQLHAERHRRPRLHRARDRNHGPHSSALDRVRCSSLREPSELFTSRPGGAGWAFRANSSTPCRTS